MTCSDFSEIPARIAVRARVLSCTACDLRDRCSSPVPFSGSNPNYLVVIGEAPGGEDRQGESLVGVAGQLLRRAIDQAFFHPSNARAKERVSDYLTYVNVVSCYPAEKKTPTQRQIKACSGNLWAQLEVIRPHYGLLCGGTALGALVPAIKGGRRPDGSLATPQTITSLRGSWVEVRAAWGKMLLMVVWHPAAVLREGGIKTGKGIELTADLARFAQVIYKHPEVQPAAVRDQPNLL